MWRVTALADEAQCAQNALENQLKTAFSVPHAELCEAINSES
jgi:hypothetical protein